MDERASARVPAARRRIQCPKPGWFAQLGRPGGKKGDVKGRVFAMSVALAGEPSSEAARGAVSSYKTAASPFLA